MTKEERTAKLEGASWTDIRDAAYAVFGTDFVKPDGETWVDQVPAIVEAEFAEESPPQTDEDQPESIAETPTPELNLDFDFQKRGVYQVCPVCNKPATSNLQGKVICPDNNEACPRYCP